jgi:hypothetical protein
MNRNYTKNAIKLSQLINQYKFVCNEWVTRFGLKQGIEFEYWVADEVGGVAVFNSEYFFNLHEIILDLTTKQKKGLILKWHNETVEVNINRKSPLFINYKSYTMGLRYSDINGN